MLFWEVRFLLLWGAGRSGAETCPACFYGVRLCVLRSPVAVQRSPVRVTPTGLPPPWAPLTPTTACLPVCDALVWRILWPQR